MECVSRTTDTHVPMGDTPSITDAASALSNDLFLFFTTASDDYASNVKVVLYGDGAEAPSQYVDRISSDDCYPEIHTDVRLLVPATHDDAVAMALSCVVCSVFADVYARLLMCRLGKSNPLSRHAPGADEGVVHELVCKSLDAAGECVERLSCIASGCEAVIDGHCRDVIEALVAMKSVAETYSLSC